MADAERRVPPRRGQASPARGLPARMQTVARSVLVALVLWAPSAAIGTAAPCQAEEAGTGFPVFSLLHSNRDIDVSRFGFDTDIALAYSNQLWPEGDDREDPNPTYVRESLRNRFGGSPPKVIVLDVEHWPVGSDVSSSERAANIEKYIAVVDAARAALPNVLFGFYSVLPVRDYWASVKGDADALKAWRAANAQLAALAEHVDFIAPSLYTFYADRNGWQKYARFNIEEAKKYGKPVYPFLWPLYHPSNRLLGERPISAAFFRLQMLTVREQADGVIVWNGPYERWRLPQSWFETVACTIGRLRQD